MTISQKFMDGLKKANAEFDKQKEGGFNYFNFFHGLGHSWHNETTHSAFIAYLLDKNAEHYQSVFVRRFLEMIQNEMDIKNFKADFNLNFKADFKELKEVSTEKLTEAIKESRRMDIYLEFDNSCIIIENKITAPDLEAQIMDYVANASKMLERRGFGEQQIANRILFVYLHRDKDARPSGKSLSKTRFQAKNYWTIRDDKFIVDENGTRKAYFLKIDYKFIEKWLKSCLKELEKHATSKARGESKTRGENGLNKIIFSIYQYLDILSYINNEFKKKNAVADFLAQGKNAKNALEIYRDEKHKITDKETREIVVNSWNEFCERIVGEFYEQVRAKFNEGEVKINKEKFICKIVKEVSERGWYLEFGKYGFTDKVIKFYLTLQQNRLKFSQPNLFNQNSSLQELVIQGSFILGEKNVTFSEWIIEQGENAASEFIKGLKAFAENSVISKTMQEIEAVLGENL